MYYHPFMFNWANRERVLATCQACVDVWLDGVARHHQAHTDAVNTFYARQFADLRKLSEAANAEQFAAQLLSCVAPKPLDFAELSARLGGIVVETHRKLGELVGSHTDHVRRSLGEEDATLEKPRHKTVNGRRGAGRR